MSTVWNKPENLGLLRKQAQMFSAVRRADVQLVITKLVLPSHEDRHCPECGLLEPHHRPKCQWGY